MSKQKNEVFSSAIVNCPLSIVNSRYAFTLVELLVVIAIIGVLIALLLPAVQAAREAARRMTCTNHLKQIGIGLHNYHDVHNAFPCIRSGAYRNSASRYGVGSWLMPMLPFVEQQARYDAYVADGMTDSMNAGFLNTLSYMKDPVPCYLCPSDGNSSKPSPGQSATAGQGLARHNYIGSYGDAITTLNDGRVNGRGFFAGRITISSPLGLRLFVNTFASIEDGTSNTVALSEAVVTEEAGSYKVKGGMVQNTSAKTPDLCKATVDTNDWTVYASTETVTAFGRGLRGFASGFSPSAAFSTILAPYGPSCAYPTGTATNEGHYNNGFLTPTSYHPGGVNVCMADASIHFVADSIDCGDQTTNISTMAAGTYTTSPSGHREFTGESPFGVWGALGTINGGETKPLR